ncbi:hypothetical protein ACPUED_13925 [Proteus mirabilis]|uniref:hypothetical protein n=1 Tax=Proteus mirabilis TaxID=584 RepID=UPI0038C67D22
MNWIISKVCKVYKKIKGFIGGLWLNHAQANNFFSGIHYLALTLAIIIGGVWGAYTFNALSMASNAEIQLKKAKEELKQIQEQIKGSDSSSISIGVIPMETQMGMIINVVIKNNGKRPISFNTADSAISVYKVSVDGSKVSQEQKLEPKIYTHITDGMNGDINRILPKVHVLIGAEKTLSYAVSLKSNGLYYITFRSTPDENFKKDDIKNNLPLEWFASTYVEIK